MSTVIEKKNKILNCAKEIIQKHGLSKLLMDEVAKDSGISKKSIYEIYKGKDDLIQDLAETFLKEELSIHHDGIEMLSSPVEKANAILMFLFRSIEMLPYENMSLLKKRHPGSYRLFTEYYEQISIKLISHLREGQKAGLVDSNIKADIVSAHIFQQFIFLQKEYRSLMANNSYGIWKEQITLYFDKILFIRGKQPHKKYS